MEKKGIKDLERDYDEGMTAYTVKEKLLLESSYVQMKAELVLKFEGTGYKDDDDRRERTGGCSGLDRRGDAEAHGSGGRPASSPPDLRPRGLVLHGQARGCVAFHGAAVRAHPEGAHG